METNNTKEIAPQAATSEAKVELFNTIRDKYKGNSSANQNMRLLEFMRHFSISTFDARKHLDVMHPAGRVQELRDAGNEIETLRLSEPSDVGRPHCIAVYVLRKEVGL